MSQVPLTKLINWSAVPRSELIALRSHLDFLITFDELRDAMRKNNSPNNVYQVGASREVSKLPIPEILTVTDGGRNVVDLANHEFEIMHRNNTIDEVD